MGTMLDTVDDPARTFSGLDVEAVAAYGNGRFANFKAAKKEFPGSHVLEIDVSGEGIGNTGDFEAGDMAYSHAGAWAKARLKAGVKRPVIYFSASNWQEVMGSLKAAGVDRKDVRIWTAHYTGRPHLCSSACKNLGITGRADATQWGSAQASGTLPKPYAGRNVDISKTAPKFFAGSAASTSTKVSAKATAKAASGAKKGRPAPAAVVSGGSEKAVHRPLTLATPFAKGPDVRALQEAIKGGLNHYKVDWLPLEVDGEFGPQTANAAAFYGWILGTTEATRGKLNKRGELAEPIQEILRNPEKRGADYRDRAAARKDKLKEMRKAHKQGPKAAVVYAKAMIGVTETSENSGPDLTRKGKKGGISFWEKAFGLGSCYWCLCFACYCVRDVGGAKVGGLMVNAAEVERMAKAHSEGWLAVPKEQAKAGDIALYCFDGSGTPDHGELVVGPLKRGMFNDVGGNTSSDDAGVQNNGGGVFAKLRDPDLLTCIARPLY